MGEDVETNELGVGKFPQDEWFVDLGIEQLTSPSQHYRIEFRMGPYRRISFNLTAGSFGEAAVKARQHLTAWEAENPHEASIVGDRWRLEYVEATP